MLALRWPFLGGLARAAAITISASMLIAACAPTPAGQAPPVLISVKTAPVESTNISGTVAYSGSVASRATVNLIPRAAGQITILNVDVGSVVKKGDVIAELDHAVQDAQVSQAEAGLAVAKAKLGTVEAGPRAELVAQAEANLTAARESFAALQQGGRVENVQAAQGNLDAALARLNSLQTGRAESIAQARANLQAAQARLQELKNGPTADQLHAAQLGVEQAKNAAYAADVQKDAACNPIYPKTGCDAAQAAAFAAHTGIEIAQSKLSALTAGPTAEQLQQAQAAVDAAQALVQIAEHPGSRTDLSAATAAVAAARAQVNLAKTPFSTADLAKAQAAVAVAEQQVKLAKAPFTRQDLDAAKAAVQQAEAAVALAKVAQDQAIVRAPIDGVISQKLLAVGALAQPATPIAVLVDPAVEVAVDLDAANLGGIQVGQAATITADSLTGQTINAKVSSIAPTIDPRTRAIRVKLTPTEVDSGLRDGLLVKVTLVTATHASALVVPASAIVQRNGQPTVFVLNGSTASPVTVTTGLTDGTNTEITNGLSKGQTIVISGQDNLTTAQTVTVQK